MKTILLTTILMLSACKNGPDDSQAQATLKNLTLGDGLFITKMDYQPLESEDLCAPGESGVQIKIIDHDEEFVKSPEEEEGLKPASMDRILCYEDPQQSALDAEEGETVEERFISLCEQNHDIFATIRGDAETFEAARIEAIVPEDSEENMSCDQLAQAVKNIESLDIQSGRDIRALKGLTSLKFLSIRNTEIFNTWELLELPNLTFVNYQENQLTMTPITWRAHTEDESTH